MPMLSMPTYSFLHWIHGKEAPFYILKRKKKNTPDLKIPIQGEKGSPLPSCRLINSFIGVMKKGLFSITMRHPRKIITMIKKVSVTNPLSVPSAPTYLFFYWRHGRVVLFLTAGLAWEYSTRVDHSIVVRIAQIKRTGRNKCVIRLRRKSQT